MLPLLPLPLLHPPLLLSAAPPLLRYIYNCITEEHRQNIPAQDFLTHVNPENPNVPANMHLLCGDRQLDLLAPELSDSASKPVTGKNNPYTRVHKMLRVFVSEVAKHFREVHQKEAVFFIDTNPALTVYTEIALCAMTEMVVPADADDFSVQVGSWISWAQLQQCGMHHVLCAVWLSVWCQLHCFYDRPHMGPASNTTWSLHAETPYTADGHKLISIHCSQPP